MFVRTQFSAFQPLSFTLYASPHLSSPPPTHITLLQEGKRLSALQAAGETADVLEGQGGPCTVHTTCTKNTRGNLIVIIIIIYRNVS